MFLVKMDILTVQRMHAAVEFKQKMGTPIDHVEIQVGVDDAFITAHDSMNNVCIAIDGNVTVEEIKPSVG